MGFWKEMEDTFLAIFFAMMMCFVIFCVLSESASGMDCYELSDQRYDYCSDGTIRFGHSGYEVLSLDELVVWGQSDNPALRTQSMLWFDMIRNEHGGVNNG